MQTLEFLNHFLRIPGFLIFMVRTITNQRAIVLIIVSYSFIVHFFAVNRVIFCFCNQCLELANSFYSKVSEFWNVGLIIPIACDPVKRCFLIRLLRRICTDSK